MRWTNGLFQIQENQWASCPVCLFSLLFLLKILHYSSLFGTTAGQFNKWVQTALEKLLTASLPCGLMERTRESDVNGRRCTMAKRPFSTLWPDNSLELTVCSVTLPVIKGTTTTTSAAFFLLKDMSLSHVWTSRKLFWSSLRPLSILSHLKRTVWPHGTFTMMIQALPLRLDTLQWI